MVKGGEERDDKYVGMQKKEVTPFNPSRTADQYYLNIQREF